VAKKKGLKRTTSIQSWKEHTGEKRKSRYIKAFAQKSKFILLKKKKEIARKCRTGHRRIKIGQGAEQNSPYPRPKKKHQKEGKLRAGKEGDRGERRSGENEPIG